MNRLVRKARHMSFSWADYFRPDPSSSNRSLKKFLQEEGVNLGHKDLVLVRKLAENGFFLSYAALESWVDGEFEAHSLEQLCVQPDSISDICDTAGLSWLEVEPGVKLVGIEGELEPRSVEIETSSALVHVSREEAGSPLLTVFGGGDMAAQPTMGGAWNEDDLQQESVKLLDGESSKELIEAFRHLFRAAPSGGARASVVAAALSRHREELNLEVAEKLEEISAPFGQAMKQLFEETPELGARALRFLLQTELAETPPEWAGFWSHIRPTILGSLAKSERGTDILILSVDELGSVTTGDQFLDHQLLDAFLHRLDELSPSQQDRLLGLVVEWATANSSGPEVLSSRLDLTSGQNQRLLIGECLRRTYLAQDDRKGLESLAEVFVDEALSAGSTAGSLALAELLRSFGELVLDRTARNLEQLTERQTLNLVEVWELLLQDDENYLAKVTELYIGALEKPAEHLSLLLRSELLQRESIYEAFRIWLQESHLKRRRQVGQCGFNWSLTVENRELVAQALREVDWDYEPTWQGEWRRPHLSYQRLGWLALCAPAGSSHFSPELSRQLADLLRKPVNHVYFWELFLRLAQFDEFDGELLALLYSSGRRSFSKIEAHQEEEREALFEVGATAARRCPSLMDDWASSFRDGSVDDVWWLSGVAKALYTFSAEVPAPSRQVVSGVIARLLSSSEKSMKDLLAAALAATEDEPEAADESVPLEVSNLTYEALAAMAKHSACPQGMAPTIKRRLAMFLLSWASQLRQTDDPYAFRETPLFGILQEYLDEDNEQLQGLLDEISVEFLELHRRYPDKLRLEVRHTAQQFFTDWAQLREGRKEAESWNRVMEFL